MNTTGLKRPVCAVDHPPPSTTEVTNDWSYTSTLPLHAFMECIGTVPVLVSYLKNFFMWDKVNAVRQLEFVTGPSDAKVAE